MLIDGVPARASAESWWRFDGELQLLSSSTPSWSYLDVLLLVGHGSFARS